MQLSCLQNSFLRHFPLSIFKGKFLFDQVVYYAICMWMLSWVCEKDFKSNFRLNFFRFFYSFFTNLPEKIQHPLTWSFSLFLLFLCWFLHGGFVKIISKAIFIKMLPFPYNSIEFWMINFPKLFRPNRAPSRGGWKKFLKFSNFPRRTSRINLCTNTRRDFSPSLYHNLWLNIDPKIGEASTVFLFKTKSFSISWEMKIVCSQLSLKLRVERKLDKIAIVTISVVDNNVEEMSSDNFHETI